MKFKIQDLKSLIFNFQSPLISPSMISVKSKLGGESKSGHGDKSSLYVVLPPSLFSKENRGDEGENKGGQSSMGKGFTLIELLVVIAIIGILAGLILPTLSKARMLARITVKYGSCMAGQNKATGRVGHWTFGEGGGATSKDWSGNKNDGVLSNAEWIKSSRFGETYYSAKVGYYSRRPRYVDCGNSPSLNFTDKMSVEAWVKPLKSSMKGSPIIYKGATFCKLSFILSWGGSQIGPEPDTWCAQICYPPCDTPSGSVKVVSKQYTINEWYHVSFTYNGNKLILYVNGEREGSANVEEGKTMAACNDDSLKIGSGSACFAHNCELIIDEVILYHRVLDKHEVVSHYNMGSPSGYPEA